MELLTKTGLQNLNEYQAMAYAAVIAKDVDRLTSQVWKLIPMRENGEDWVKQLNTVIIEISGLHEIFVFNPLFLQLLAKLEGMGKENPTFSFYRKTVFECISLLQELKK